MLPSAQAASLSQGITARYTPGPLGWFLSGTGAPAGEQSMQGSVSKHLPRVWQQGNLALVAAQQAAALTSSEQLLMRIHLTLPSLH